MSVLTRRPILHIVDDDASLSQSLVWLMGTLQVEARAYRTAQDFLAGFDPARPACLLVDVLLPELGGIELYRQLRMSGVDIPTIFMTAHSDVSIAVATMKAGAIDFIEKPFSHQRLVEVVQATLPLAARRFEETIAHSAAKSVLSQLTGRERDVLRLMVKAKSNKEIASALGLTEKTIEYHRARLMKKISVNSLSQLLERTSCHLCIELNSNVRDCKGM